MTPEHTRSDSRASGKKSPERTCIATGETGTPASLIRFAIGPEGEVVADLEGKLPGRGIWVSARREAIE